MTHDNTDIIGLHTQLAAEREKVRRLTGALDLILGPVPDKYGYRAAYNVMRDDVRAYAGEVLAQCRSEINQPKGKWGTQT